jgi:hypothetical protein
MKTRQFTLLIGMNLFAALAMPVWTPLTVHAQTVVIGHSFVRMAPWQDSGIQELTVRGFDSQVCSYFQMILPYLVPVGSKTVVLVEGTNDITMGTPPDVFRACLQAQVAWIQAQGMSAVLVNVSPWNQNTLGCHRKVPDPRPAIAAYNSIFPTLAPTVVDEWRAAIQRMPLQEYGWAIPDLMSGPCGIHPGQEQQ